MNRDEQLSQLKNTDSWDFIVIGGGASGLGAAVDATSRGFKTLLLEGVDFAKGTSSRSTKLLHGGVRYLAQGDIKMVTEALTERNLLAENANHLFKSQSFVIPNYSWWKNLYYAIGLKLYDLLSKKGVLGSSKFIWKTRTMALLPNLIQRKLVGGVTYEDGKFDDARLAINLAQTAIDHGATVLNHIKVIDLLKDAHGQIIGVKAMDMETEDIHTIMAKIVVNATGVFANKILKLDGRKKHGLKIIPSQGIHLVLEATFLQSTHALMIPKTSDGRVLFAIPWHGKVVVGTTDTASQKANYEPKPLAEEVTFILSTMAKYLTKVPTRADVLSVFAGLRPLVAPAGDKKNTKEISRGHKILVSNSGLISILGGKWTTYRKMGENVIDKAIEINELHPVPSKTTGLLIHGAGKENAKEVDNHLSIYGSDLDALIKLQNSNVWFRARIHPKYNYTVGEIIWSVRMEMARTIEDILARRVRLLFLDARAAMEVAPAVAKILAGELGKDLDWAEQREQEFIALAQNYILH